MRVKNSSCSRDYMPAFRVNASGIDCYFYPGKDTICLIFSKWLRAIILDPEMP